MGGTPISHRQELRKQRIVREADGSVACCPERSEKNAPRQNEANLFAGNCLGAVGWAERPSATDRSCESSG